MFNKLAVIFFTTLFCDILPAQTATATIFGSGCGSITNNFLKSINRPIIGQTASALLIFPPSHIVGVNTGISNFQYSPINLSSFGMPGCSLLHSTEVFGLSMTGSTIHLKQLDVLIPYDFNLVGMSVYLQSYSFAPGVNQANFLVSNGITWFIGNQ